MIFQGEEWAASTPWPFFTAHPEPELADAVRSGRLGGASAQVDQFPVGGEDLRVIALLALIPLQDRRGTRP
jgi:1,4-alpha-glucan branching enzyme